MKSQGAELVLVDPVEFFDCAVREAMDSQQVSVSEEARFYIVSLLSRYISTDNLFARNAEGKVEDEVLALRLAEAAAEANIEVRRKHYQRMGDFSLYIAGFFAGSLERKLVDVDYYIDMGGAAYNEVSRIPTRKTDAELFAELADSFSDFVAVLGQVSEESRLSAGDHQSLLQLYEVWVRTGSDRIAKQLAEAGIVLSDQKKASSQ